jgi:cell division protein FtsA
VYAGARIQDTGWQCVGGGHISNDLSIGLYLPLAMAEKLKVEEGNIATNKSRRDGRIILKDASGFIKKEIDRDLLDFIIDCRVRETFARIKTRLESSGVRLGLLGAGVHLTGGGSKLRGIDDLARDVFGIPARLAQTKEILCAANESENPRDACALGILKFLALPSSAWEGQQISCERF